MYPTDPHDGSVIFRLGDGLPTNSTLLLELIPRSRPGRVEVAQLRSSTTNCARTALTIA
jgi:hypothetical protein